MMVDKKGAALFRERAVELFIVIWSAGGVASHQGPVTLWYQRSIDGGING